MHFLTPVVNPGPWTLNPGLQALYKAFKKLFSMLPIAALIGGKTLVLHGGLFRHPITSRKVGEPAAAFDNNNLRRGLHL